MLQQRYDHLTVTKPPCLSCRFHEAPEEVEKRILGHKKQQQHYDERVLERVRHLEEKEKGHVSNLIRHRKILDEKAAIDKRGMERKMMTHVSNVCMFLCVVSVCACWCCCACVCVIVYAYQIEEKGHDHIDDT